jgi:hypothetical protein
MTGGHKKLFRVKYNPVFNQQGINGRFFSAEAFVEYFGVFASSPGEDMGAERAGNFFIENTGGLEYRERVGLQRFRPFVSVLTCSIAA